jgi:hypothetical protein
MNCVGLALNKMLTIEERNDAIILAGRKREPGACDALAGIINDETDELDARVHAARALCSLDKHDAYPVFLEILASPNKEIILEAIASAYLLNDTRTLFPLVNLHNKLDTAKEQDSLAGYEIIRALGASADPRSTMFLEELCKSENADTARLSKEALAECKGVSEMLYTFNGPEAQRKNAAETKGGKVIWSKQDLKTALAAMKDEQIGGACYATYVVLPHTGDRPFSNGCYLVLAPRRSEHVFAAKGQDILAAGEIGINQETLAVEYIDNHSGGYLPDATSFKWVKNALVQAEINCPKGFSALYPDGGYFTDAFLSQQPLYKK